MGMEFVIIEFHFQWLLDEERQQGEENWKLPNGEIYGTDFGWKAILTYGHESSSIKGYFGGVKVVPVACRKGGLFLVGEI
jgi:hypothetical protein